MAKGMLNPMGGQAGLLKQMRQMQEQLQKAQQELAHETVTASVGGGAVKVVMSGDQVCQKVEISPELLQSGDLEMLQDLVLSALNDALNQARELSAKKLGPLAGGIPGLNL